MLDHSYNGVNGTDEPVHFPSGIHLGSEGIEKGTDVEHHVEDVGKS